MWDLLVAVLHRFVISLAPICNLCPDLRSLCYDLKSLSRFVIFSPRFEIPKAAPICNPSPPDFFVFSLFRMRISTWITFGFVILVWWNLVWDAFGIIPENDLGFNKYNPNHWWRHHLVLSWYRNLNMNYFWHSRSILMKLW